MLGRGSWCGAVTLCTDALVLGAAESRRCTLSRPKSGPNRGSVEKWLNQSSHPGARRFFVPFRSSRQLWELWTRSFIASTAPKFLGL